MFRGYLSVAGDLAPHKLDVVLTDRPASPGTGCASTATRWATIRSRLYDQSMVQRCSMAFHTALDGAPMLPPTRNNAPERTAGTMV